MILEKDNMDKMQLPEVSPSTADDTGNEKKELPAKSATAPSSDSSSIRALDD